MSPNKSSKGLNASDQRIPVTILTGFLGAGKTTLLKAILSKQGSERIAVIINEFGDIGLDHELIEFVEDEVVLMASGCLCCSLRGDLSRTITNLIEEKTKGKLSFERIVIETTGLADPGPILQTLLVDSNLARNTRMDGVITVVDAANGPTTLDSNFEAVSQIAMADLILLSKTDIVSKNTVRSFKIRLNSLSPTAEVLQTVSGNISPKTLWNLSGLRKGVDPSNAIAWTTQKLEPHPDPFSNLSGLLKTENTSIGEALHDKRISSASIIVEDPIKDAVFDRWLDTLIKLNGPDILRIKGIVFLDGLETPFVFHGVQHIFDPPVRIDNWIGSDRRSRIVVIARNLENSELQRSFDMLL